MKQDSLDSEPYLWGILLLLWNGVRTAERARYLYDRFLPRRLQHAQHLDLVRGIEPVAGLALGERCA